MPSSNAIGWPSSARFALSLAAGFALTLSCAWLWGVPLIERLLPVTHALLGVLDNRFDILFLGVERNWQDTVVRLRVDVARAFFFGGQIVAARSGWLEVTTTAGAVLQPLVIAPALAFALPADRLPVHMLALFLATGFAFAFLLIDLPLTLHAYVWDMFIDNLDPNRFSPLMIWHTFLHGGGRLGLALLMGLSGWRLARFLLND